MTTPLHAGVGVSGTDLTFNLVEEACQRAVAESETLDFKRDLPLGDGDPRARALELAKDLAAMANGRGGMLVYGVRDESDRAAEVVGVPDLGDGVVERQIRQVAYNLIYPPLQVKTVPLTDGEVHVLVVQVDESDDAPHLVQPRRDGGNDGWLMAPYRSGSDTLNMVEKQLEAAYRQRIDGRRQQVRQLRELHDELAQRHIAPGEEGVGTLVAVMQPQRPRRGPLKHREPSRLAGVVIDDANSLALEMAREFHLFSHYPLALLREHGSPRRAVRRHVFKASRQARSSAGEVLGPPACIAVELHDDGTIGVVWRRGASYSFTGPVEGPPPMPSLGQDDMDIVSLLVLSLIVTVNHELEVDSDYQVRVSLLPRTPLFLIPDNGWSNGRYEAIPPSPPVEAALGVAGGPDLRAADFMMLGEDLANMVEQTRSSMSAFWELPRGADSSHPRLGLARQLLGGQPDHPASGTTMT